MTSDGGHEQRGNDIEKVGLLFVHGMGQQARWQHLHGSVVELTELLRRFSGAETSVSVIDRTATWTRGPGEPTTDGDAPVSIFWRQSQAEGGRAIDFECHEVWWADLGIRTSLRESVRFWLWGLGQWGAPIYEELDASRLEKAITAPSSMDEPASPARDVPRVIMPKSVAEHFGGQLIARANLAWAAAAAVLTVFSLTLVKRLGALLGNVGTSPSVLVQYLGDVQVYQQRARPGEAPVSDPGHPERVSIRRRMIAQMVAMGARDYKRWYIMAHSLGSVVAFNGIGEIGHALPNYLPKDLWVSLEDRLQEDPDAALRKDLHNMMPARPTWLEPEDCINRLELFKRMRGFVTYGSPLDKFAALWPRIVAFEDRANGERVFEDCEWINIVSASDPVADSIDRYHEGALNLPRLRNVERPGLRWFGISHVQYWRVPESWDQSSTSYYERIFAWLTGQHKTPYPVRRQEPISTGGYAPYWPDYAGSVIQAILLTGLLLAGATVTISAALLLLAPADWELPGQGANKGTLQDYWRLYVSLLPGVAAFTGLTILLAGHFRWLTETMFDRRVARHEASTRQALKKFMCTSNLQITAALGSLSVGCLAIVLVWCCFALPGRDTVTVSLAYAALFPALILFAAMLQSAVYSRHRIVKIPRRIIEWLWPSRQGK